MDDDAPPADAECVPNQMRCQAAFVERCSVNREWVPFSRCHTDCLCEELGPDSARCRPPRCEPGERRCAGATMQSCNACQTGFEATEICAVALSCTLGLEEGHCAVGCAGGESRCVGASLQVCDGPLGDFEAIEECLSPQLCDASLGRCELPFDAALP